LRNETLHRPSGAVAATVVLETVGAAATGVAVAVAVGAGVPVGATVDGVTVGPGVDGGSVM
jgi:CBS-domain-containing membrane protein